MAVFCDRFVSLVAYDEDAGGLQHFSFRLLVEGRVVRDPENRCVRILRDRRPVKRHPLR